MVISPSLKAKSQPSSQVDFLGCGDGVGHSYRRGGCEKPVLSNPSANQVAGEWLEAREAKDKGSSKSVKALLGLGCCRPAMDASGLALTPARPR